MTLTQAIVELTMHRNAYINDVWVSVYMAGYFKFVRTGLYLPSSSIFFKHSYQIFKVNGKQPITIHSIFKFTLISYR